MLSVSNAETSVAQQNYRTLSGELRLDVGMAQGDLNLRISVRNHSFVVISVFPFIALRPITSEVSESLVIESGSSFGNYSLSQIVEGPVDYTIKIECPGCEQEIPNQYYSPTGNRFSLVNEVYIDPEDLLEVLDIGLISRARISGTIGLGDSGVSERDLSFLVSLVNAGNSELVYQSINELVLPAGENSVAYLFTGIDRATSAGYRIEVKCSNCFGKSAKPQSSSVLLTNTQNYSEVSFVVSDHAHVPLAAMLHLIL